MFFANLITSININDKVLEVGPGATPFDRADIFLELKYKDDQERIAQSGRVGILKTGKPIIYYDGGKFPFKDHEFDYIICSHVLEHVSDVTFFLAEIQRVSKKGYLEFPTIYYDYLYNFPEHKNFLFYKNGVINWMTKEESGLSKYAKIQEFFFRTIELEYFDYINSCKNYFFQGFEWQDEILSNKVNSIDNLIFNYKEIILLRQPNNSNDLQFNYVSLRKHLKFKFTKAIKKYLYLNL